MKTKYAFLLFSLIMLGVFSCKTPPKKENFSTKEKWYQFIPPKTGYTFIFNKQMDPKKFPSAVYKHYIHKNDRNFLAKISYKAPYYLYIIQKDDKLKSFVSVGETREFEKIFNETEGEYEGSKIYKTAYQQKKYYGCKTNGIVYISDSRVSLENVIRKKKEESLSEEVYKDYMDADKILDRNADYNLIQFSEDLKPDLFNQPVFNIPPGGISGLEAYDVVDASKDLYTGIAFSTQNKLMDVFKGIGVEDHEIYKFIPEGFTGLSRFAFDDFNGFYSRFLKHFNYQPLIKYTTKSIFNTLYSVTFFEENFNKAMILQFEDPMDFIKSNPYEGSYNSYDLYSIKDTELIYKLFKPVLKPFKASYFTLADDYVIITENKAYLKKLINDYENRNTLINYSDFEVFAGLFPSKTHFENLKQTKIDGQNSYIYKAYTRDEENVYVNLIVKNKKVPKLKGAVEHLLTVSMEDTPVIKPQLVYNHKHKTYRIIYQNQNNELIYKDLSGHDLWKRKLENKIIGKIYPVDLYRNGKIQYTFVTKNKWYIIDRYGRNVEGFPVGFKNDISRGISVFDYDKNRKYRFGIVRGKKFDLYDKEGKKVKGFEYKASKNILFPAQHYRIDNKDYILVQTADGKLHILDRRGNIRIPVDEKFDGFQKNWKVYNKKFINLSQSNELITIDTKGNLKKAKLQYDKPLKFDAVPSLFAAVSDNQLLLNKNVKNIELGNYHTPLIYKTKKGKNLVFLSREDNNKIYSFNNKGEVLPYFPVTGQQVLDMAPLGEKNYLLSYDTDRNLMIYRFR